MHNRLTAIDSLCHFNQIFFTLKFIEKEFVVVFKTLRFSMIFIIIFIKIYLLQNIQIFHKICGYDIKHVSFLIKNLADYK